MHDRQHHNLVSHHAKVGPLRLIPIASLEQFGLSLGTKDEAGRHTPPASFLRTSSQGMADAGFAMCSARR